MTTLFKVKVFPPSDQRRWTNIDVEGLESLEGEIISIEHISVKCNKTDVYSPFLLLWNNKPLVRNHLRMTDPIRVVDEKGEALTIASCQGMSNCPWKYTDMTNEVLRQNINAFFASDLHVSFGNLKKALKENVKSPFVRIEEFYPKEGKDCMKTVNVSLDVIKQKKRKSKDPCLKFLEEVISTPHLSQLLNLFSLDSLKELEEAGIEIMNDDFPPIVRCACLSDDTEEDEEEGGREEEEEEEILIPLGALQRLVDILQVLDENSNTYLIPKQCEKPSLYLLVPPSETELVFVVEVKFSPFECKEGVYDVEMPLNPKSCTLLPSSTHLGIISNVESVQRNINSLSCETKYMRVDLSK